MKTMDDLPKDAFDSLQMILGEWERAFPGTPKQVAIDAYIRAYYGLEKKA